MIPSNPQPSQFRRPWSPEPFIPASSVASNSRAQADEFDEYPHQPPRRQRREASDVSVEALDLADYSRTLRTRQGENLNSEEYRSDQLSGRGPLNRHDSLQARPLVSRGGTLSSNTHSASSPTHRPLSVPPPLRHIRSISQSHRVNNSQVYGLGSYTRSQDSEIDISHFPVWSRNWYTRSSSIVPASPPDIYTPLPTSHLNPTRQRSPFDPGQIFPDKDDILSDPYGYVPPSSHGHESTRNLLPWGPDPLDSAPIHSTLKEERMRMLEREFGPRARTSGPVESEDGQLLGENGKPLIGTVDAKGNLVTQGPIKRTTLRILQMLLILTAGIPSIYAALIIKSSGTPPPAGKAPAFTLYIISVITLILFLYLFVFRPCCCAGKRSKDFNNPLSNGMMILPIQGLPNGKKGKNSKNGKKGQVTNGDVQVNLIVDPEAFGRREEASDDEEDDDWNRSIPGSFGAGRKKRPRRPRRKSVFAGLTMEEDWKQARGWKMKLTYIDVTLLVLWGAVFVFIMTGKRCPSGGFNGWCNAYNVSSAAACLLSVSFGVSIFFDVKDLNDSKTSPRTRT